MTETYVIAFKARRLARLPAWFPFNGAPMCFEKNTTWADAHDLATKLGMRGAWDIYVAKKDA